MKCKIELIKPTNCKATELREPNQGSYSVISNKKNRNFTLQKDMLEKLYELK